MFLRRNNHWWQRVLPFPMIRTRGGLLYYHYDRLGTVIALTDRQGQMVDRYYYDVFGQPLAGTSGPYNSYGLTGKEYDKKLEQY